ncbi:MULTISPECIES: phage regulatory CII family protein [Desulfobacula]|uniref:Uncharacterized protein n=2 Tax=Desulfobacula TaxID=28222 RepID=K0NAR2_DESTT|nr:MULTISPECIES: phage regulatory CII family protein [Desulfobacula]CCK81229.1 uncharacterized protein TOL2_C30720 [Desulfobacula toluolica Tol2]SDU38808.1 hypothetical protein SAMN04487931_107221 [Desulfobacula phenolica]
MVHVDWRGALLELQKIAHDYGSKELADYLGISVNSLYKQLDPNYNLEVNPPDPENPDGQPRYKLGFKTIFKICCITGNFKPVSMMLNSMDRGIFTIPKNQDKNKGFLKLLSNADKESGEAFRATLQALEDNKVSRSEALTGIKECDEAMSALADLKAKYKAVLTEFVPDGKSATGTGR